MSCTNGFGCEFYPALPGREPEKEIPNILAPEELHIILGITNRVLTRLRVDLEIRELYIDKMMRELLKWSIIATMPEKDLKGASGYPED